MPSDSQCLLHCFLSKLLKMHDMYHSLKMHIIHHSHCAHSFALSDTTIGFIITRLTYSANSHTDGSQICSQICSSLLRVSNSIYIYHIVYIYMASGLINAMLRLVKV